MIGGRWQKTVYLMSLKYYVRLDVISFTSDQLLIKLVYRTKPE